ncbi:MAG: DUF559 domain-containing protein [Vicinamibacterales bacterium]
MEPGLADRTSSSHANQGWVRRQRGATDLLCQRASVAVELDGAQHLADPLAYRRDRRKDLLLQENGYLVLRFLAEDVGKELDLVLDTILRALSHRQTHQAIAPLTFLRKPQRG